MIVRLKDWPSTLKVNDVIFFTDAELIIRNKKTTYSREVYQAYYPVIELSDTALRGNRYVNGLLNAYHEFHENLSFRHVLFHEKLIFWYQQEGDFTKYD